MIIIITVTVSFVKYRGGEVNYLNSDATWHTLLTMEAYEETPISVHKFLPIVSLGVWITNIFHGVPQFLI